MLYADVAMPTGPETLMDWNVVHVRVNDAGTGKPTPVRVRCTAPEGRYLPPLGRPSLVPVGWNDEVGGSVVVEGQAWAYVDGSWEMRLPAGELQFEIAKGPDYVPLRQTVVRKPGQIALRFVLERRRHPTSDGWHAGDVQAHCLSPAAAALEGAAEGLQFVNLLAREWDRPNGTAFVGNLLDFSGQQPAASKDGCQVVVNTLNDGGSTGQLVLLNCHRVVYPLRLGWEGFDKYTLADWCPQCRRKGGLVVWPWLDRPAAEFDWSLVDAFAWTPLTQLQDEHLARWYALLDRRVRVALVGGSAKEGNATPLGAIRTEAFLGPSVEATYGNWIEAIRLGRTVATRGPTLRCALNDKGPGMTVTGGAGQLMTTADGLPAASRTQLIRDGVVTLDVPTDTAGQAKVLASLQWAGKGWLTARCIDGAGALLAHGGPIYLA